MRNKYRKLKAVNTDSFVKKNFNNHAVTNDARNGWGTSFAYSRFELICIRRGEEGEERTYTTTS